MEIIELSQEEQWIIKIIQELNELPDDAAESERWWKQSIYKIPTSITDLKTRAYKPQILSIGPYHHGAEHLRAMEKHKRRALSHFLKRSNKPLEYLVELLIPVVKDAKAAYDQLDSKWHENTDEFLKMMILDGCFILKILRTSAKKKVSQNELADDYERKEPIFSYHEMLYVSRNLRYDMLMLENQIPILVLEKLALVQNEEQSQIEYGLSKLILDFFSQGKGPPYNFHKLGECLHILDVHHRSLVLQEPAAKSSRKMRPFNHRWWCLVRFLCCCDEHQGIEITRSVTELKEAGISIKQSESRSLIGGISFRDAVLKLPPIAVDDALESLYLNLMAFERFHVEAGNEVTSYVCFIGSIIANTKDVSLLRSCGIIDNVPGSDMAVANLFNSLSSEATLDPNSSLDKVRRQLSAYCQRPGPRWKAYIRRYYLTTPYATASVIATSILFVLTIAQTVLSVLSYVKQSPNA